MRHRLSLILLTVALLATVCLFGAMVRHVQNAAETVLEWPEPRFVLGGVTQIPQDGGVTHADIWDEKEHVCSRGDTFRSISQAHFNTDKYEEALIEFNQTHPLGSAAVRRDRQAAEGETVYIPPARILEKYMLPKLEFSVPRASPN
jgi:hypothetical protein